MSVLPPDAQSSLNALLENLISANNDSRTEAEKVLNEAWIAGGDTKQAYLLVGLAEQSVMASSPTVCCKTFEWSEDTTFYLLLVLTFNSSFVLLLPFFSDE